MKISQEFVVVNNGATVAGRHRDAQREFSRELRGVLLIIVSIAKCSSS
jgi:hypothetical protein